MAYNSTDRFRIINSIPYKLPRGTRYESGEELTYEELYGRFSFIVPFENFDDFVSEGIAGKNTGQAIIKYLEKLP